MAVSRRDFTNLFAVGGSAALFAHPAWAQSARTGGRPALAPRPPAAPARRSGKLCARSS